MGRARRLRARTLRLNYATRWSADGFQKARESFDHAIAIDPTYALAYAGLADAYYYATTLFITPAEGVPRARAAAMTALRLDDSVGEAHAGFVYCAFSGSCLN